MSRWLSRSRPHTPVQVLVCAGSNRRTLSNEATKSRNCFTVLATTMPPRCNAPSQVVVVYMVESCTWRWL